jgi:hypothetical protein
MRGTGWRIMNGLPPTEAPAPPTYWANQEGLLFGAMSRYLQGATPTPADIGLIRAYLVQWIDNPFWMGPNVEKLRKMARGIETRTQIEAWLRLAVADGIDPL